jgi:hypothetical protein
MHQNSASETGNSAPRVKTLVHDISLFVASYGFWKPLLAFSALSRTPVRSRPAQAEIEQCDGPNKTLAVFVAVSRLLDWFRHCGLPAGEMDRERLRGLTRL